MKDTIARAARPLNRSRDRNHVCKLPVFSLRRRNEVPRAEEKQNALNEIRLLASVRHENVISYKEAGRPRLCLF